MISIFVYLILTLSTYLACKYSKTYVSFFGILTFLSTVVLMYLDEGNIKHTALVGLISCVSGVSVFVFMIKAPGGKNGSEVTKGRSPKQSSQKPNFQIPLPLKSFDSAKIHDIRLSVSITGASGSGKSTSPCYVIAKYFAENKYCGIIHDFKNFELVEILYPLFKNQDIKFHCICPTDLSRTSRFNPVAPSYIQNEMELNSVLTGFMQTLTGNIASSDAAIYFTDAAASLIGGVLWRLKESFPAKCNLPYLVAFILGADHDKRTVTPKGTIVEPLAKLADFIKDSAEATIIGSVFLRAMSNERELGSMFGTIASNLRKLASPELFYILSADEINLAINSPENKSVLAFVNTPGSAQTSISPILALGIEAAFNAMSEHNRENSFVMLDEAPKLKLATLGNRVSSLRTYKVCFVYIMQDIIQAKTQYNGHDYYVKEVLTNLSTQFLGKSNDPESGKYYQGFFPLIKEDSVSRSYSETFGLYSRKSVSQREKRKVDTYDFTKLKAGQFYLLSGGEDKLVKFKNLTKNIKKELPPIRNEVSIESAREFYREILIDAKTCFYNEFHSNEWE